MKIAITGLAFRFPGDIGTEADFWEALKGSVDLVTQVSGERWGTDYYLHPRRAEPGRSITFASGQLSRIDQFDAQFFGISPREAKQMDPQQRLLLEMTWEAMENGGQIPAKLAGSDCAVYIGISSLDYGVRSLDDLSSLDAYFMTGSTLSIAANRISYVFDLHGPSMSIDTACSSSLVALHQACQSLRNGESSLAIAGGVHLLMHPYPFVGFTKASMLSADGHCKAFDASGDGYVRSEGGAVVILKPLDRAIADGDPVHAVILASGVNTDGHKSGITIPSSTAQANLMRTCLTQAEIAPQDVIYIEAHGTGTAVGDPIETAAIGEAIGKAKDVPLYIGSVKSNLGHLEPASGMAGLVKTVLCLKRRALPPTIHLHTPNPNIDFEGLNLRPVTEFTPLQESGTPLRMGVNSFGFGGANAHVVLEEHRAANTSSKDEVQRTDRPAAQGGKPAKTGWMPAPAGMTQSQVRPEPADIPEACPPLILSARQTDALKVLADNYADLLDGANTDRYYDISHAAVHRRQLLEQGLAVFGASAGEVADRLRQFAQGGEPNGLVQDNLLKPAARTAFVYSGNGAQWLGMGRKLLETSAVFRSTIEEIDTLIARHSDLSIRTELLAEPTVSQLHLTEVGQPALFAVQVGITRILRSLGVKADAALGHSVGEIAAAWAMGALSLEQAVTVIHERSSAQAETQGAGRMAAIGMSAARVRHEMEAAGLEHELDIAAYNSPDAITVSGSLAALDKLRARLEPRRVFFRVLDLDYAFHSWHMDALKPRILRDLADLRPTKGDGRFISTVTGQEVCGERLDAHYWWDNIRQPVQLEKAITTLAEDGYQVFVEIGPHAIMQRYVSDCLAAAGCDGRVLVTLKRNDDDAERLIEVACRAHLLGCPLDLEALFPRPGQFVALPTYPWQRERHWHSPTSEGYVLLARNRVHPLLGYRLKDAEATWENQVDTYVIPYLRDHVVGGAIVLPAAAYAELALAASNQHFGSNTHEVEDLEIRTPILLDAAHARTIRFELNIHDGGFQIKGRPRLSDEDWMLHAVGRLTGTTLAAEPAPMTGLVADAPAALSAGDHYRLCHEMGLDYGPAFQGVEAAWPDGDGLLARIRLSEPVRATADAYILHPVLTDACFQSLLALFQSDRAADQRATFLPVRIGRLRLFRQGNHACWCKARIVKHSPHSLLADFRLLDAEGRTVAELEGCRFRAAPLALHGQSRAAEWVNTAVLKPRPSPGEISPLPACSDLRRHAFTVLERDEVALRRAHHFGEASPLFDALVSTFAYRAVRQLAGPSGKLPSPPAVKTGVPAAYLDWLLGVLEQDGYLEHRADGWTFVEEPQVTPEDIWLAILGDNPAYLPELSLAGRVGSHLAELLSGQRDSAAFAASLNASTLQEQHLESSPAYRAMNKAVLGMWAKIAQAWPANSRLRVLVVGSAASVLTRALLPLLPAERCDCVIAIPDEEGMARAEAEFATLKWVSCLKMDPDTLILGGEVAAGREFDVVVAAHALHGENEPRLALNSLKSLLARGGLLMLLGRHPDRLTDFIAGIASPPSQAGGFHLAPPSAWQDLLQETGFAGVETIVEPQARNLESGVYCLLATNPDASEPALPVLRPARWLLLVDGDSASHEFAGALSEYLGNQGQQVSLAGAGGIPADLTPFEHVVHLAGLDAEGDLADADPLASLDLRCLATLDLIHAIEQSPAQAKPRLWLVTSGGAVAGSPDGIQTIGCPSPSQAPLWGLGRVLMNEHPDLGCTLIDLQASPNEAMARRLGEELLHPDGEAEIILTADSRYATRMRPLQAALPIPSKGSTFQNVCLDFPVPGQLKNLQWRHSPLRDPTPDEIEIKPKATGLNFRDVMYAMGLLSDEAVENGFAGPTMGMELSGVVTRIGTGVAEFSVGDPVIAFAPAGFAKRAITKAASVVRKPKGWSFEEAATVPTVFFTVYYALHFLARLQPGEKVLIHGAAGGVGIAAIQLARHLGAEIFATAGSEEKRDFVRLLGADHVMSSRDLAFADEILAITAGRGIDVVINSLAGEAINRNLRVLRPFGRFLELGKRDFYENTRIGLRPFKDNITYYGIDADQLMVERPELTSRLFKEVMALFEQGVIKPLPYRAFPADRVVDAFRYMQQSKQIGKIVISFEDNGVPAPTRAEKPKPLRLAQDATYLVTGGGSGFGLKTALWLAERGAGHLVLLSRRGAEAPEAEQAVADLRAAGAKAHIKTCDVTEVGQLEAVIEWIGRELPPLKGVVHAAMVLDDGLIRNLDRPRFETVLRPKILGAWNLHHLTRHLPLDLFVLYSSATTFIGNPGQANYVAANLYLEALAAWRRGQGLPATAVCWGAIADVGYLTRHAEIKDALQTRLGGAVLASDQALAQLGEMIAADRSGVAIMDFDWHTVSRFLPALDSLRFEPLRRSDGSRRDAGEGEDIHALIENRSEAEVREILQRLLTEEIAQILRLPAERIPADRSLYDIGMDSLMGVELVLGIEKRFGINLPAMALSEGPNISRISDRLMQQLLRGEGDAEPGADSGEDRMKSVVAGLARQHGVEISSDEIEGTLADLQRGRLTADGASA
jgi:acyl transferase domain-containing protein/NADPH:quinone reductase-like Zn-dependent oxidoreductase/acyl carrier protein